MKDSVNYMGKIKILDMATTKEIMKSIEKAQKDAYNEAIKDAIENVTASIETEWSGNAGYEYCDDTAVVNKQSIYKLLKK